MNAWATLAMRGNETFRHAVTRMKASAASVIERAASRRTIFS